MDNYTPIQSFLTRHAEKNPVSFHMPGHKGSAIYKRFHFNGFLENIMDCDITEIIGADNLFQTEGIIKEVQEIYADLYDAKKSYLLINGTSGGIIAAVLASVPKGKKLIMARNCHKSVFNALTLADVQPLYAYPELIEEYGISGAVRPEEIESLLSENPDAEAVILPSPNYYGICSDIKAIAEIVHKYGKILIVDQAHGAHLKMFSKFGVEGLPTSAEEAGADIIINSIHKTLASFTQSAILNLNSDRISPYLMEDKLQCIESTSPSYLLMASLDVNACLLREHGRLLMKEWAEALDGFYSEAKNINGLEFIGKVPGMDWTKINFSLGAFGISGDELERQLTDRYNIFIELYTGNLVMCMTGIGNTKKDISSLLNALQEIAGEKAALNAGSRNGINTGRGDCVNRGKKPVLFDIPKIKRRVPLRDADGLICASSIIPYPPGIPFICPGEKFDREAIAYIRTLREKGEKVIGVNDLEEVIVGAE
jgi:lysine decarboxylase